MEQTTNVLHPDAPLLQAEKIQVYSPAQNWTNEYAQKVVLDDFNQWASFRQQNHDQRWQVADQLFLGWQPQNVWQGTRIPRSSLGLFLTMEQEESLLARVMAAIFPLEDNVTALAKFGTTPQQARLAFKLILEQIQNEECNAKETLRQAFKQGFLYGNGIIEVSWKYLEELRKLAVPIWEEQMYAQMHGAMLGSAPKRKLMEQVVEMITNQPILSVVDIRDFYIDPQTFGPDIQKARGCAVRQLVTKEQIKSYQGQPGYNVPDDMVLDLMAKTKVSTPGDQSKQIGESYRGVNYQPTQEYTGDPSQERIELIRGYRNDRTVWLLNRKWAFYNQPNIYGCKPFLNAFYVDVPGRFYGLSLADICEPEQRLQQSIINARVDELALTIHSPFVKKAGDSLSQNMMRMVPGRTIELQYPEQFKKIEWPNITQQSFIEVDASSNRLHKYTGLTEIGAVGGSSPGGNSANRTATGIQQQVSVSNTRIGYIIENLESNTIEPFFAMIHRLNRQFLNPNQVLYLLGEQEPVDPLAIIHAEVSFKCRGSRKMQTRAMTLQVLPELLPVLLNPSIASMLAQQGQALDINEVFASICDALGVPETQWFKPMSQEQMQMQQAQNPDQIRMQMQQARLEAQGQQQESKGDTELLKSIMPVMAKNEGLQKVATGYDPIESSAKVKSASKPQ